MVVLYFTAPFSRGRVVISFWLVTGLVLVAVLLVWQVRSIIRSPYPRLRAVEAVSTTLPLFLVISAATHFLIGAGAPGSYSQDMTRVDALYFVVTVFATVGFGDITPVSETARVVTMLQMVIDLVFVGVIARVLLGAIQEGLRRQGRGDAMAGAQEAVPLQGPSAGPPATDSPATDSPATDSPATDSPATDPPHAHAPDSARTRPDPPDGEPGT
jgi:hypothetical protein